MKFPKVLLVARCFIKKDGKILILHRVKEEEFYPDLWELPGGKIEEGQDINSASEREVLEETGLLVKIISPSVFIESKINVGGKYKDMLYLELVLEAKVVSGKVKISHEHSEYKWVTPKQALNYDLTLEARKAITFFLLA